VSKNWYKIGKVIVAAGVLFGMTRNVRRRRKETCRNHRRGVVETDTMDKLIYYNCECEVQIILPRVPYARRKTARLHKESTCLHVPVMTVADDATEEIGRQSFDLYERHSTQINSAIFHVLDIS